MIQRENKVGLVGGQDRLQEAIYIASSTRTHFASEGNRGTSRAIKRYPDGVRWRFN